MTREEKLKVQLELARLISTGLSFREVTERTGYNRWILGRIVKKFNVKTYREKLRERHLKLEDVICQKYKKGWSIKKICVRYNIAQETISKIVKDNGLFRVPQKSNRVCNEVGCGKSYEHTAKGRKYCYTCYKKRKKNGVCENCNKGLYRKYRNTKFGRLAFGYCRTCKSEFEIITIRLNI